MIYFRHQSLEETRHSFILNHTSYNPEATLWIVEVSVLDAGLDDVERGRDNKGCGSTCNRCYEVLKPGSLVIVCKPINVSFCKCGSTKKLFTLLASAMLQEVLETRTANDPGAFRAAVQPQPLYNPKPSSLTIFTMPRPRNASGFVCRLIFRTSSGRRTISPIPIMLKINSQHEQPPANDFSHLPSCQ